MFNAKINKYLLINNNFLSIVNIESTSLLTGLRTRAAGRNLPAEQATMNPKPRPNHQQYLAILRSMTPEQRLLKAFELSEFSRQLFKEGLRNRFPEKTEAELHSLFLNRIAKCHNRNY